MVMWRRCDCNDCTRARAIDSELSKLYARELAPMGPLTTRIVEHRILTRENESNRLMTCADMLADSTANMPEEKGFDRAKFINSSPFGLTTRTMGTVNHDSAYIIKMADAAQANSSSCVQSSL